MAPYTPGAMAQSTAGSTAAAPLPPAAPAGGRWANVPWAPILLAVAAIPILVWLGRDMTFYHDEYAFLLLRDLSVQGIFAPHNEHLSATLVVLYRLLVGTVGTVSYWPYLAVTFALHLVVAGIVFVVVRRETSERWALGAMAVMLVLGSGGDDILWAFQSATIGATAAGMAAVVIAPRRPAVAAVLLTIALATSGVALAFLAGTGLHLLADPMAGARLAGAPGRAVSGLAGDFGARGWRAAPPSLEGVPEYVLSGLVATAAGMVGSALPVVGQVVLLALAFGLGLDAQVPPVVLALLVSSVAFFFFAGLVRAELGAEQAAAPRYVYVAAPGLLITGAVLLARIRRPWRDIVGVAVLTVALVGNCRAAGREPRPVRVEDRVREGHDPDRPRERRQPLLTDVPAGDGSAPGALDDTSRGRVLSSRD